MPEVRIYSTHTCTFCRMAKKFFDDNSVKYAEYYVDDDEKKAAEMFGKSGQMGVPVIDIGGKIIVGYDRRAIREALHME